MSQGPSSEANPGFTHAPPVRGKEEGSSRRRRTRTIGRYQVVKELGRGAMGIVVLARQANLNREVALKILRTDVADEIARTRFKQEAEVMARLKHPGIVGIFDVSEHQGLPYFVMDYIDGRPLSDLARQRPPLSQRRVLELVRDIAHALDHAHRQGVIHRDLKPSNVLVGKDGRPVITDFGLAADEKNRAHLTQTGFVVGTPLYMAPEQASAKGPVDGQSDVYSLGVLMYELLTGTNPLDVGSVGTVMNRAARGGIPAPRSIDPEIDIEVDRICQRATYRDRGRRYASAAAMAHDAERALETLRPSGRHRTEKVTLIDAEDDAEGSEPMMSPIGLASADATEPQVEPGDDGSSRRRRSSRRRSTWNGPPSRSERPASDRTGSVSSPNVIQVQGSAALLVGVAAGVLMTMLFAVAFAFMGGFQRAGPDGGAGGGTGGGEVAVGPDVPGGGATGGGAAVVEPPQAERLPPPRPPTAKESAVIAGPIADARDALSDPTRVSRALDPANDAVVRAPELAAAYAVRARVQGRLLASDASLADWRRAFELEPRIIFEHLHTDLDRRRDDVDRVVTEGLRAAVERADPVTAALAEAALLVRTSNATDAARAVSVIEPVVADGGALARRERAVARWAAGDRDGAIEDLDEAVRRAPDDVVARLLRARFYRMSRRWDRADADAEAATEARPDLVEPWVELGYLHRLRIRFNEASGAFQRAARMAPDAASPVIGEAQLRVVLLDFDISVSPAEKLGHFNELKGLVDEVRSREPRHPAGLALKGWEDFYEDTLKSLDIMALLGGRARKAAPGTYAKSEESAAAALALDPTCDGAHRLTVHIAARYQDDRRFEAAVGKWLTVTPDRVEAFTVAGEAARYLDYDTTEAKFSRAYEENPNDAVLHLRHGAALVRFLRVDTRAAPRFRELIEKANELDGNIFNDYCAGFGVSPEWVLGMVRQMTEGGGGFPMGGGGTAPPPGGGGPGAGPPGGKYDTDQSGLSEEMERRRAALMEANRDLVAEAERAELDYVTAVRRRDREAAQRLSVDAERAWRAAIDIEPSPLPLLKLAFFYLQPRTARHLGRSEAEILRAAVDAAKAGVESCEPTGFPDWMPITLAVRAITEAFDGRGDDAFQTIKEAEALIADRTRRPRRGDLDEEAERLIYQARELIRRGGR